MTERLLEDEGIYFFFKHKPTLHLLCDGSSSHTITPFYSEVPYYPPNVDREAYCDHIEAGRW